MPSLNRVQIMGHLGRDPEARYLPNGTATTNFSVATSERWTDKQSGEKKEKTDWHNIVTWRHTAEACGKYLQKGSLVYVEGKIQTRDWQDKDGNKRYTTEIVASDVKFLSPKHEDNQPAQNYERDPGPPPVTPDDSIPF